MRPSTAVELLLACSASHQWTIHVIFIGTGTSAVYTAIAYIAAITLSRERSLRQQDHHRYRAA
jgi:predicted membrane protein